MKKLVRTVLAIAYILAVYLILSNLAPRAVKLSPRPRDIILASILLAAAEVVRGIRLAVLYRSVKPGIPLRRGIFARFVGNVFAVLTPSVAGGEVARGVALHGKIEGKAVTAVAIAAIDGGLDLLSNYSVALAAWLVGAGLSAPLPELLALPAFIAWIIGILVVASGRVADLAERIAGIIAARSRRMGSIISKHLDSIKSIHVRPRIIIVAYALSVAAWMLMGLSYAVFCYRDVFRAVACVAELYLYGVIPVPGGIGPGEAILSQQCTGIAAWRALALVVSVVPGLIPIIKGGL